jgi:long-chain acyl-CoA synthetase
MKTVVSHGLSSLTVGGILKNQAINYPEDLAVVSVDQNLRYTFKELNNRVNRLANGFLNKGMRKGDRIVIYLNDGVEWLEIAYAANKIGAIWTPCNFRFTAEEIRQVLDHCQPKWLIFGSNSKNVIEKIKKNVPSIKKYVVLAEKEDTKYLRYESLLEDSSEDEPVPKQVVSSEDLAAIVYTSGTTGVPKGVMHTHSTFLGWAFTSIHEGGITREDRILNPYPMFHMGGMIASTSAMFAGAANFMLGKFDPVKFITMLEKEKLTMFKAIPTIIHAINNLPQDVKDKHKLSSVRLMTTSSAPLFAETKDAFLKQWPHMKMIASYSATEMYFTTLRPRDQVRKVVCVGPGAFGHEIIIMNKEGKELPQRQPGLVYGKGISRFIGYYKNPEANKKSFHDDWFTCEDVGYLDEEGYLYLIDRDKDMIISGGENIASGEVENLLLSHPAIFECAVVGIRDEQWGEIVKAVVSLRPGEKVTPDEIIGWCAGKIAGYKRPREVEIIPEVPKNTVGKILKREIRDQMNEKRKKT